MACLIELIHRGCSRAGCPSALAVAIVAAVLMCGRAEAASSLRIDSLTAEAGDTVSVDLRLINDVQVYGVQFTLAPSAGSVLEYLGAAKRGPATASAWTAAPLWRNDSLITLLYSGSAFFEPGDTLIMSVSFRIREDSYTRSIGLALSKVKVIGADLMQIPDFSAVDGELRIIGQAPLPGDANADGKADVFDLLEVLGVLSGKKVSQSADIDGNGKVDVFDLLEMLKLMKAV